MAHRIRLRGPWRYRLLQDMDGMAAMTDDRRAAEDRIAHLPAGWTEIVQPGFRGRVCLQRMFQRPSGLTPRTSLFLCVDRTANLAGLSLNRQPLAPTPPGQRLRWDVTARLLPRNLITIVLDVSGGTTAQESWEHGCVDVSLEIVEHAR